MKLVRGLHTTVKALLMVNYAILINSNISCEEENYAIYGSR